MVMVNANSLCVNTGSRWSRAQSLMQRRVGGSPSDWSLHQVPWEAGGIIPSGRRQSRFSVSGWCWRPRLSPPHSLLCALTETRRWEVRSPLLTQSKEACFAVKFENRISNDLSSWWAYIISLESLTLIFLDSLLKIFKEHLPCALCARFWGTGNAPGRTPIKPNFGR